MPLSHHVPPDHVEARSASTALAAFRPLVQRLIIAHRLVNRGAAALLDG